MRHHSPVPSGLCRTGLLLAIALGLAYLSGCSASPTPTLVPTFTPRPTPSPTPLPSPTAEPTVPPTDAPETFVETPPSAFDLLVAGEPGFAPTGLTVDQDGNLYIVDALNHRVQKYDSGGELLYQWGSQGAGDGEFNFAQADMPDTPLGDVAVDGEGNIYVVDYGNHRVQKFDKDGQFLTKWGAQGSAEGQFDGPGFIAVNSQGTVLVSELGNARVQKFDAGGAYLSRLPDVKLEGESTIPTGIAIDGHDNVYVVVQGPNHILKYSKSDNFIKKIDITHDVGVDDIHQPSGIALDEQNDLFVADYHGGTVRQLNSKGQLLARFPDLDAQEAQLVNPWDVATDGMGSVYVTDPVQGVVLKIPLEPTGTP